MGAIDKINLRFPNDVLILRRYYMDKEQIKYVIFGFICFGVAVLIVNLFKIKFKSPIIEYAISAMGFIFIILAPYYLLKSKRSSLFFILGLAFTLGSYVIKVFLWDSHPNLSILMFPIFVLLAIIFVTLGTISSFREIFRKKW
jgi:hypothetical protein